MKGILLASHGNLAAGMKQTASLFFGENIPQLDAIGIQVSDSPDEFSEQMKQKIQELDQGEGVVILCDLFAGTPAHTSTQFLEPGKVDVICGLNLPMLMEMLGMRMVGEEFDAEHVMEAGRTGITPWAVAADNDSGDDFY